MSLGMASLTLGFVHATSFAKIDTSTSLKPLSPTIEVVDTHDFSKQVGYLLDADVYREFARRISKPNNRQMHLQNIKLI